MRFSRILLCPLVYLFLLLVTFSFSATVLLGQIDGLARNPKAQRAFDDGQQFEKVGDLGAASDVFKRANKLAGGGCAPCLKRLNDLYRMLGDDKESGKAAAQLEQAVSSPREKANAAMLQGAALMREEDRSGKRALLVKADGEFRHGLQLDPNSTNLLFFHGLALGRMGDDVGARAAFTAFVNSKQASSVMRLRARRYLKNPELVREKMAPAFSVRTLQGDVVSLDNMEGKVVLLDFWATWCGPCNAELPHVHKIAQQFQGKPFIVLSVSVDRDDSKWRSFVQQHNMTWPQYRDGDGMMSNIFETRAIPHYYLIDSDGVLRQTNLDRNIDGKLKKLVAQAEVNEGRSNSEAVGQ